MHLSDFHDRGDLQALLAGMGAVVALGWLDRRLRSPSAWARRGRRLMRLVGLTWLVLTTWSLVLFLALPAGLVLGYSADDAAAMAWMRQNVVPGTWWSTTDMPMRDMGAVQGWATGTALAVGAG